MNLKIFLSVTGTILVLIVLMYPVFGYVLSPLYYSCGDVEIGMTQGKAELILLKYKNNSDFNYLGVRLDSIALDDVIVSGHFPNVTCHVISRNGLVESKEFIFYYLPMDDSPDEVG